MNTPYQSWADALEDPLYPQVDKALRSGQHISDIDDDYHQYLNCAYDYLVPWYARFHLQLHCSAEQVYYLTRQHTQGEQYVRNRHISKLSMMTGMVLLSMMLDGDHLSTGWLEKSQVLAKLLGYIPQHRLGEILGRRHTGSDMDRERMQKAIGEALHQLKQLRMITIHDDHIKPHTSLYRFLDPVRAVSDQDQAARLQQLIQDGHLAPLAENQDDEDATHEA